ncbi:MAG TPA: sirohydrochlorin cobaltochelatase [Solidesulfovibrio magneticus]|nr:sirohydrochlorin cobaltochelatase [Solidesulfovibrio magneticus]
MTQPCGIILAAHGSRHPGAMAALDAFRESVAAAHPGAVVAVARTVGRKHGSAAAFGGAKQVLDVLGELTAAGCARVVVQSLHVVPGGEYHELLAGLSRWLEQDAGRTSVSVGAPLLADLADVDRAAAAIDEALAAGRQPGEAAVLMGHGAPPPGAGFYEALRERLTQRDPLLFFGAMPREKGAASLELDTIIASLAAKGVAQALLLPFFTVAGAHACADLAGEQPDSWRGRLEAAGVTCRARRTGLLEIEAFAALWRTHLDRALDKI